MTSPLKHESIVRREQKRKNSKKKKSQRIKNESISLPTYGGKCYKNIMTQGQLDTLE